MTPEYIWVLLSIIMAMLIVILVQIMIFNANIIDITRYSLSFIKVIVKSMNSLMDKDEDEKPETEEDPDVDDFLD